MNRNYEVLFALTRLGINHPTYLSNQEIDWQSMKDLAERQGLSAVVLNGIEQLKSLNVLGQAKRQSRAQGVQKVQEPPKVFLLEWIGETLQGYEYRYDMYRKAIAELAGFYNSHGYKMMVVKGYACCLDWPNPEHRPCGDIDIWLFGKYKEADATLEAEKPAQVVQEGQEFKVDRSHHHHTVFYWRDFMVENHYDFINVHSRRSNAEMEKVFKELGKDDGKFVDVEGEIIYLPSPNLHALFLIKHMVSHFASTSITLRHVLDWGFFVKAHTGEIDWDKLGELLEKFHMKDFFCCVNAICVENFGFNATIFHGVQFNPTLKERVLNDILDPICDVEEPKHLISRIIYKYRRWKGNSWKRVVCFEESNWTMFWGSVMSHLLKPQSI